MSDLQQLAFLAEQYKQQFESGHLSSNEFRELIGDLNIIKSIEANSDNLEENEKYRATLMAVIQLAGVIY
jgi:hypothetical protein